MQTKPGEAETVRMQVRSSERAVLIKAKQLQEVSLKGRDCLGMLRLLPEANGSQDHEAPRSFGLRFVAANGGRSSSQTGSGR